MDITVSHLNSRLALQLPSELPLGLVFVVGHVENLTEITAVEMEGPATSSTRHFELAEASHRVRCELSTRAAAETKLQEGSKIRAGGHLMFDRRRADYFLMVRDVEIVEEEALDDEKSIGLQGQPALKAALATVARRSQSAALAQANLPGWVQRMAPPGVQAEIDAPDVSEDEALIGEEGDGFDPESAGAGRSSPPVAADDLSEELLAYLLAAMESDEEMELPPELISETTAAETIAPPIPDSIYDVPAPAQTTARQQWLTLDWPLILLVASFVIMAVAAVIVVLSLLAR